MNPPPAKPVDRLALILAVATVALINLAVVAHFAEFGPAILVKGLLGIGLATGAFAWFRLQRTHT